MMDEALHDRIEQYLLGQLSEEAAARLEAEMAADPALADQAALQRLALLGMQRLAAREMRARFEQWDAETDPPPARNTPPNPWFWTTLALLALIALGAFWYFGQSGQAGVQQEQKDREIVVRDSLIAALKTDFREKAQALDALLAKQGADSDSLTRLEIKRLREELEQKDRRLRELERRRFAGKPQIAMQLAPAPPRFRGGQDGSVLGNAREALEGGKFEEAVRLLKSIPAADPRQAQVTQILPYALFYAGKYREAASAFTTLWEQDADNETMNAQGYLLLCHVAEGNLQEARQMRLVILQNPQHKFYKTATELTETLR